MSHCVAILGAGIGAAHAEGYAAHPEHFQVAAICDLDRDRAEALAATLPGAVAVTDLSPLIDDPAIDLIDICLPPHLHVPTALAALDAGKQVVCEKPLALALSDIDRLERAEGQGRLYPVFQYRYGIGMAGIEAVVAAGLAGAPLVASLETHWARDAVYYAVPWRGTWAGEGGGAVLGHAIHIHDLISRLFGPIAEVAALTATRANPIEVEDCAALSLRFASGALGSSSVTLGAADDTSRLRLVFEHVTVESGQTPYAPAATPWRITARDPGRQEAVDEVLAVLTEPPPGFAGYLAALADTLAGRPSDFPTLTDGRRSIELVTAIYDAASSGRTVALPLTPAHPLYAGWRPAA
ncbi:MAG: Gfo/Idh/MocA family oxidoreductase [Pseudomonadota bacterium]